MKRKYLTQEEIEKLLSATDRMPFPERNRCLILMAFIHGFRASELLGLRLSDIDLAGRQLYIRRLKNGFSTCHPLLPDEGNDSNLLIVFYVQIMPDDFVMQLHRF